MLKQRDYKREYALYHGRPEQIKRRAMRNKSRRLMVRAGLARKGDGKDVHHLDNNPAHFAKQNMRVISKHINRSIK